jgi:tRNA modification GTPase
LPAGGKDDRANEAQRDMSQTTGRPGAAPEASVALLTARGRGAIAALRWHGDCRLIDGMGAACFRAANGKPLAEQPINRIVFGRWEDSPPEEVVVCRTDQFVTEIHCHGGALAAVRIMESLAAAGARVVDAVWQQAQITTGLDAECLAALSRAVTPRTAAILLEQSSGLLRDAIEALQTPGPEAARRLDALLAHGPFARHLTEPWRVVFTGRPNVGKSSLVNALLGFERSITHHEPGTTRDAVTCGAALDGWPVELTDTAGLRGEACELERAGMAMAQECLRVADCRVVVLDLSRAPEPADFEFIERWPGALVVANKCDLPDCWGAALPPGVPQVSAHTLEGIDQLASQISRVLVARPPPAGTAMPVTARQIALLEQCRDAQQAHDWRKWHALVRALLDGTSVPGIG